MTTASRCSPPTTRNGGNNENNTIQNVTALFPWRAAGVAVYGGYNNTIQNFYIADTLATRA